MLPWQLFSTALTESSGSLVGNTGLMSKVYFPRLIIPMAAIVMTAFVDFLMTLALLAVLMVVVRRAPDLRAGASAAVRRARAPCCRWALDC